MSRAWVAGIAFAGGVVAGLLFAKWYANNQITTGLSKVESAIGLSSGVQSTINGALVPVITA